MEINTLLNEWQSLLGVAAFVAVLINVLKTIGVVQDSTAMVWSAGLNLAGLVALFAFHVMVPTGDVGAVDTAAGQFANVAAVLLAYIIQLGGSKLTYTAVKGVPIIGKTFTVK